MFNLLTVNFVGGAAAILLYFWSVRGAWCVHAWICQ